MLIPARGTRNYKEVWADEDSGGFGEAISSATSQAPSTNQGVGSIEQMTEDMSESNNISVGPMLARLIQCLRPERRAPPSENTTAPHTNGDTAMGGMDGENGILDPSQNEEHHHSSQRPLPVATALPDSAMPGNNWKQPNVRPSWAEMDDRVKQELRHIGFLAEDAEPDYDGHHDDDIAARLRWLQEELQRVSIMNGARKAKMLEIVEEDMARQEWVGIQDDLDNQLNAAYGKRHRNTSKSKGKLKRAGAAAGYAGGANGIPSAGVSRPGVGEPIKQLMERREMWRNVLGPAVDHGKREVPRQSVFREDDSKMMQLLATEREQWHEAQEGT